MRVCFALVAALLVGPPALAQDAPSADPGETVGPSADHRVLRPQGRHKKEGEMAVVPGPTPDCMAKAQVFVPWSVCRAMGSRPELGPRRYDAYAKADPPLPTGATCAFACTPSAGLANFSFLVPVPGYRGRITCPVSARLRLTIQIADSEAMPSPGATIQWQTDLNETIYSLADATLMEGRPEDLERMIFESDRKLDGPNACPAGQPRRLSE